MAHGSRILPKKLQKSNENDRKFSKSSDGEASELQNQINRSELSPVSQPTSHILFKNQHAVGSNSFFRPQVRQ